MSAASTGRAGGRARRGPAVHLALLRGVNVGGKNKLPMKGLAELFRELGCHDVRTYIQSGNVLYRAAPVLANRMGEAASSAIADRFGLQVPVVTRTAAELDALAAAHPFADRQDDPARLFVVFLKDRPTRALVAGLDPARSPPDELMVRGRDVFLHLPNGAGRSKLTTQYFDSRLRTVSTVRNWRTVLTLAGLAREA